ncbi:MAG: carbamate kinase [bacterium]|nr:carbamate kinase [bacterium]
MKRFSKDDLVIITLGGNAVVPAGALGTINEQFNTARSTMSHVAKLCVEGIPVVVSHGNGPVVGNIVIRNETAKNEVTPMPLFVCGADSQGGLGFLIQNALRNELHLAGHERPVAALVTQVEVDPADSAFENPSKPIGPFYSAGDAEMLSREKGWVMREDAGRGHRRVVPSPDPKSIIEIDSIKKLVEAEVVTIAAGGGGIPVKRDRDGLLKGIDAVIDKDLAAVLLARQLKATHLVFITGVDAVAVDFGKPDQRDLEVITLNELKRYQDAGEFPPGSMGPKMEATRRFLEQGGREAIVCSPDNLADALAGRGGTRIISDRN